MALDSQWNSAQNRREGEIYFLLCLFFLALSNLGRCPIWLRSPLYIYHLTIISVSHVNNIQLNGQTQWEKPNDWVKWEKDKENAVDVTKNLSINVSGFKCGTKTI